MGSRARWLFRSVSCGSLTLAAAGALSACNAHVPAQKKTSTVTTLSVSCAPNGDGLNCRAMGHISDDGTDPRRETDVTDVVTWTTSNVKTASVLRGRVTANEPGTVTIVASAGSGGETVSSSVLVVVDRERTHPQVAYDLKGEVRDVSSAGVSNVSLTLVDDAGRARTLGAREVASRSDGAFGFAPLLSGQYRLRAAKKGYRPVEKLVNVPDSTPLTLVLLSEPQ